MLPNRLNWLSKFNKFYNVLIEQAKTNIINEHEFMMLIAAKAKSMGKEAKYRKNLLLNKHKV